jgi:hypothetical protein
VESGQDDDFVDRVGAAAVLRDHDGAAVPRAFHSLCTEPGHGARVEPSVLATMGRLLTGVAPAV